MLRLSNYPGRSVSRLARLVIAVLRSVRVALSLLPQVRTARAAKMACAECLRSSTAPDATQPKPSSVLIPVSFGMSTDRRCLRPVILVILLFIRARRLIFYTIGSNTVTAFLCLAIRLLLVILLLFLCGYMLPRQPSPVCKAGVATLIVAGDSSYLTCLLNPKHW